LEASSELPPINLLTGKEKGKGKKKQTTYIAEMNFINWGCAHF
jgi:hypothetical protein